MITSSNSSWSMKCPEVAPPTLAANRTAKRSTGEEGSNLHKTYSNNFDADVLGTLDPPRNLQLNMTSKNFDKSPHGEKSPAARLTCSKPKLLGALGPMLYARQDIAPTTVGQEGAHLRKQQA